MHMCACVYHMYLYLQGYIVRGRYIIWIYSTCLRHLYIHRICYRCISNITQPNLSMLLKGYVANTSCSPLPVLLAIPLIVITSTGASSIVFQKFLTVAA